MPGSGPSFSPGLSRRGGELILPSVKTLSVLITVTVLFPLVIPGGPESKGIRALFPPVSRFLKNK